MKNAFDFVSPGWGHECVLEQGLLHSGGGVPHGIGGYKIADPQWHVSSEKPAVQIIKNQLCALILIFSGL